MLRRALLLATLLAPLTALGQQITISQPSPYTRAECEDTSFNVVLNWSIPVGTTIPSGATYRILVSTISECSDSATPLVVASGIAPDTGSGGGATNQRYPAAGAPTGTLTINTFVSKASVTCGSNPTVYTCAQLVNGSTILAKTDILTLQVLDGPPAKPVGVTASPGENAINVAWQDGASGTVPTEKFTARAWSLKPGCTIPTDPADRTCLDGVVSSVTTNKTATSARLAGLLIGTQYGVDVIAVSGAGTPSEPSNLVYETPINVNDYWEVYQGMGGQEPGGCAAGSAGALSLLVLAGLVRTLRRRS